jgi:hypothetical protein
MNGKSKPGRRGVLQAIAAAAATAAALTAGLARPARALPLTKEVRERSRYRMTEHIRRFYQTNRY